MSISNFSKKVVAALFPYESSAGLNDSNSKSEKIQIKVKIKIKFVFI